MALSSHSISVCSRSEKLTLPNFSFVESLVLPLRVATVF